MRSNLRGTSARILVSRGLVNASLLTVNHFSRTLYWVNSGMHRLEACDPDGNGRRVVWINSTIVDGKYTAIETYKVRVPVFYSSRNNDCFYF